MNTEEKKPADTSKPSPFTRRDFIKTSAAASATALASGCASLSPAQRGPAIMGSGFSPQKIRVGVIGCGGRGTGAARDCIRSSENIEIYAMADLFQDRLNDSKERLQRRGDSFNVSDDRSFVGFDAYKGVLNTDVDMVILATPPAFRPQHLEAAINANKHVFTEKPVAVDPIGIRSVMATSDRAAEKGLAIVAGTQRRHDPGYIETMKRIHDGAIGDIVSAQCYWNQGDLWVKDRQPGWSDVEWQCRNWLYFTWLSGDHIVEQHVHNLDVINWAMQSPPSSAMGMGGRQVRTDPKFGNVFDHFAIEYTYPNGARVMSMCRQCKGTSGRVSEHLVGTRGSAYPKGIIEGRRAYRYEGPEEPINPYVQEHTDLIASIRNGRPLNEGRRVAESTMTAIMGRMSAYTGREVSWDWMMNASKLDLVPKILTMGDIPVEPIAVPGQTKLI